MVPQGDGTSRAHTIQLAKRKVVMLSRKAVSKKEKDAIKNACIKVQSSYVSRSRNEVYGGYSTNTVPFYEYYAPACEVETRELTRGTLLISENPRKYFSRLTGEQPTNWLGVGSVVYLTGCFNFNRIAKHFGFDAPVDDVISGARNPLGEAALHPLTITSMGKFGSYTEYTLTDAGGRSVVINDSDYPKFELCVLNDHPRRLAEFLRCQKAYYESVKRKRDEEAARYEKIRTEFFERVEAHVSNILLGTKLWFGTDAFEVKDIQEDKFYLHHWRSPRWVKKADLLDYRIAK
jgi:hypothetical protein